MDAKLKTEWIDALRSGKYRQTKGVLKRGAEHGGPFSYCCLGVLCEVQGAESSRETDCRDIFNYEERAYTPPFKFCGGLTGSEMDVLVSMNDSQGNNFAQIADYIEENISAE